MAEVTLERPELFFCIAGPMGVDVDNITQAIETKLTLYGYKTESIRLTDFLPLVDPNLPATFPCLKDQYEGRIASADRLRESFGNEFMALAGLFLIGEARKKHTGSAEKAAPGVAYVIRQLKRPEEIQLFRQVYGKQVFQVSCYADENQRTLKLAQRMRDDDPAATRTADYEGAALSLIKKDEHEEAVDNGQRMREVFPLADVFIDATSPDTVETTINRALAILFGYNFHSPSRDEYGMYLAKSASLRSLDLSRQVGAAIFTEAGEIKALGCNEVPSPKGGTYWEGDPGDSREFRGHVDTNEEFKYRLLSDVIKNFVAAELIDKSLAGTSGRQLVETVKKGSGIDLEKSLLLMDLIEYGRILHAEMNAITDAARKGVPLENTTLYCTTFPCHLCAKHIISSGIRRVVYIEPYPKGYTHELYREEIALERMPKSSATGTPTPSKVYFEPFMGIAPYRYRDFFEKGRRKDEGEAKEWQDGMPRPIIKVASEGYILEEVGNLKVLVEQFAKQNIFLPDSMLGRIDAPETSPMPAGSGPQ